MNKIEVGEIVTLDLTKQASNTFIVDSEIEVNGFTKKLILKHPLYESAKLVVNIEDVNKVSAILKDDTERCLDYAKSKKEYLDYNLSGDLDALCLYFVFKRQLTSKQKSTLSNICGILASIKFNNDVQAAMDFIVKNEGLLDDFNRMWYNNFNGLFRGSQPITSKKQRASIFNIAGFIVSQLENPTTLK